jgi:hypothetical protein
MSSRRHHALIAALSLVAGAAGSAQSPAKASDSLLARVQSLDSVLLVRARTVDSVRQSLVRPIASVDVHAGALEVRTEPALEPRVREAVRAVAALVDRRGSALLGARVASHVASVVRDSTRSMFGTMPVLTISADTVRRWSPIGQRHVRAGASPSQIANGLAAVVEQLAMQGVDSALAAWVMVGRVPLQPRGGAEDVDVYGELATTESSALRRCRARDLPACLDALGVDSMPGSRLARWYAPEDYRSMLRTTIPAREDSAAVAAWIRCRANAEDAGCRVAAASLPNSRVPMPLPPSARFTFLREVLDAGGPSAFDRLVNTPGPLSVRLAAAANEPVERTADRWLRHIEESRPDRMRLSPVLVVAALGWTGAILGLALLGRTSWV